MNLVEAKTTTLTLAQKVRVARRFADKINESLYWAQEEMSAWGAPSECMGDVLRCNRKWREKILKALDLSMEDLLTILDEYCTVEGQYTGQCPPKAFYDSMTWAV